MYEKHPFQLHLKLFSDYYLTFRITTDDKLDDEALVLIPMFISEKILLDFNSVDSFIPI